ncbi:SAF domain-containing protein [Clavibacter nebraskensis]|uniref:SAF domain-containing protein n=1 Tax=Clavibacter nebraskensis TaxID=31963 RepID=UPI003F4B3AF4
MRVKRPWTWKAGAVALIVAGALGGAFIYSSNSNSQQVFVSGHDIARGQIISQTDLGTLDISQGQSSSGIPVADAADVLGQTATVDLPAGSLLTPSALAPALSVPEGKALVGLTLKRTQLPAQALVAGDHVAIVPVAADAAAAATGATTGAASAVAGDVSATARDEAADTITVDVYVPATAAADLTSRAAAGAVAIYLTPEGK